MSKTTTIAKPTVGEVSKKQHIGTFHFEFDDAGAVEIPQKIHIIPMGEWMHDAYGPIKITQSDLREFVQNFNANVRKGVFITAGHEGWSELPAVGWMTELEMRDTGLWASVEWNKMGKDLLSEKAYKFFSPEFYRDYEDPQTHQIYRNVLTGGALTKSPYFKELEAVVFSDKNIKTNFNNNNTMNLADILAKDIATLTDDEKAFVKANQAELTDEQKVSHATLIVEAEATTNEEAVAETTTTETTTTEETKVDDTTPVATTTETAPVEASEKKGVTMTFAEKEAFDAKIAAGEAAVKELTKNKLDSTVKEMVFGESNSTGKFLPKSADNLRAFVETLNEAQLATFSTLVKELPNLNIFKEAGATQAFNETSVVKQVDTLVEAKMKASEGKLGYADALKAVFAEHKGLYERYNEENAGTN